MSFVFSLFLVIMGLAYAAEVRITNNKELMDEGFNAALTCMSQLNINADTCSELLDTKNNLSDTKYDGCKCLVPCVAKAIGMMNKENGKWDEKRYVEIITYLEVAEWKSEAEIIGKNCQDTVNTHCSAGYPLLQCAMKHSVMLQKLADNYTKQKQMEIDSANATNVEYEDE